MRKIGIAILLFFGISFCFSLTAQKIKHIGINEGLNARQAFNVIQDKKGFMWISTRLGFERYDGKQIKHYPINLLLDEANPSRITEVILDNDSSLWAFTNRGTLYQYNEIRDEFVIHNTLKMYVKALAFDSKNRAWLGARENLYLLQNDSLIHIQNPLFKGEDIKLIQKYDNENMLVITSKNIIQINIKNKKIKPFIDSKHLASYNFYIESCFYEKGRNRLWIGSLDRGLFYYDIADKKIYPIKEDKLTEYPILFITSHKNSFLLGTEGAGMAILSKSTESVERFYNRRSGKNHYIHSDAVYGIYPDMAGRIWLSTYSNGLHLLDFNEQGFKSISLEDNSYYTLSSNVVCSVIKDSDENLWFATDNGLNYWDRKNNIWKTLLNNKNVITLFQDSRNNIWASVYSSGVYLLDNKGNIIKHFHQNHLNKNSLSTNFIYSIIEDNDGNIWFGGKKGSISKYEIENQKFTHYPVDQVNSIFIRGNQMFFASELGVFMRDNHEQKISKCKFNDNLRSLYVADMYFESDTIVWLATYGDGINRCNINTGRVQSFSLHEGLYSNIACSLLPDDTGNLWFSTENGIGKINMKTFEIANFSKADGLIGDTFRQNSKAKDSNGNLFFGSYSGVVYFNPNEIKSNPSKGKIVFQDFQLFNQIVKSGDENSPLKLSLDKTSKIVLKHNEHSFSISFTAVDYLTESRQYMWILDGVDKKWTEPTSEHIANYTNLSPNTYTFRLKYLGANKQVLDERQIKIIIKPAFWNTPLARIFEVLLALTMIYIVYRYIRQMYRKKQAEEKINFFINTAHDIRTPLTLINSPIYQLREELEASEKTNILFDMIIRNLDKLNKMFSQLLDFQKVYEMKDQLILSQRSVNDYLEEKIVNWQSISQKKGLKLILERPDNDIIEWFDAEKIDRMLDNLVSNAFKYTPKGGEVKISLTATDRTWRISVIDNGIGISKQDRKNLFQRFYRAGNAVNSQETGSGLGLLLIKQYATLHRGNIGVQSAENKGSIFYVEFERGTEFYRDIMKLDDYDMPIIEEKTSQMDTEQFAVDRMKVKILIVEDNNDLRTYLKLSLDHYYNVHVAKNGKEAWDNVIKINPDFVITDLQMPEMDGFQLLEKIKNTFETSHIPVILLTVVNEKNKVIKGFNLGVDDYIEKPFDVKYLRLKIDNIIRNRKTLRMKFLGVDKEINERKDLEIENHLNADLVQKATRVIEENIANPNFTISDFSKELGFSRTLLYTKFNAITGYTPNDFIKIIRMKRAIELFGEKTYSINEIAFMVGFEEPAYFSTCFKKIYGKSPSQFIEENFK